ncbi:unnamed protein product [Didymodactylos carnosus]|uniref:Retrotransposon gag domain-containing protein n=1 Tax=Didymodactylos carnosus TaxID=1234261 RepID=A0A814XN84_9BILA|nr:unnamed protein product [Didymodactylos carnosus]CAF3982451.1 unnamed protein product [Didymodactylos carnosus]
MKERMKKLTNDTKVRLDDMAADTEDIKSKGKEMAEKLTTIQTDMTKLQADVSESIAKTELVQHEILKSIAALGDQFKASFVLSSNTSRPQSAMNEETSVEDTRKNSNLFSPVSQPPHGSPTVQRSHMPLGETQTIVMPARNSLPIYSGTPSEKLLPFLLRLRDYTVIVYDWHAEQLLNGMSQLLQGTALEWFLQLRAQQKIPDAWDTFQNVFIDQFTSPLRLAQMKQQWHEYVQKSNESVSEFIVRLLGLWKEMKPQETEADLVQHIYTKLHAELVQLIGVKDPLMVDALLAQAKVAEQIPLMEIRIPPHLEEQLRISLAQRRPRRKGRRKKRLNKKL